MRVFLRSCLIVVFLFRSITQSYAQFTEAQMGVNGLTCSQCSRNVEMQIRRLSFVKDVNMDLEHTEGHISFKAREKVDISRLAKAVKDAGFSVRYIRATINLDNVTNGQNCFSYEGDSYVLIEQPKYAMKGVQQIQFSGNGYEPKKEAAKWSSVIKNDCEVKVGKVYFIKL